MGSVITIDDIRVEEFEQVSELLVESYSQYQESYESKEGWLDYAESLRDSVHNPFVDRILVARDGAEILGSLQLFTNSEAAYHIPDLAIFSPIIRMLGVSPSARGKGVAQALLKESISYAREKGADHIYLHSTDLMADAIRLYEWLGFKRDTSKDFNKLNFVVKCFRYDM
ncbi:GNAT family N-acetyltransferase [Psychrobacillus sp. NPDC096623]|uniref:GNAT family N-acetyltransferase n=1 Tax=Psychrobacillus sp. NPDC096623 TaxID=3364492 RepID=UPI0037FAB238